MRSAALLLAITLLAVILEHRVQADFYYNRVLPKDGLESKNLKCVPGRTVIKIEGKVKPKNSSSEESDDNDDARRTHMNSGLKEEHCKICVCSAEGKDEHCSGRPARNVNECIRIANIVKNLKKNIPYDHERGLSYRIRRDYIWHNDEIPYNAKAKCKRGHSYYSNNLRANDTDIVVATDIDSLLDYSNTDVCYHCICSVGGDRVDCISRDIWFCNYYRYIRDPDTPRDMYKHLFQQDRPAYFRQLSWRLRRTMDSGIYDLFEAGGDTLCCSHPDGHRRHIHNSVRNKLRLMRRHVPKENLLGGSPGGDYVDFIVNND